MAISLPPERHPFDQVHELSCQVNEVFRPVEGCINDNRTDDGDAKKKGDGIGQGMAPAIHPDMTGAGGPRKAQPSWPIATATSAMRTEKAHSLSYHPSTRTVRPATTIV